MLLPVCEPWAVSFAPVAPPPPTASTQQAAEADLLGAKTDALAGGKGPADVAEAGHEAEETVETVETHLVGIRDGRGPAALLTKLEDVGE
eukprot:CAMPEP_0115064646 /NCGR_PEP_ID=MMETSP0227-20121206/9809_1 /TAXON_ID=89957 /ORGANISM="Polarella glacialis, Strain CCMP 1383" /LENGTH=89 /DNA_ID=CAMNT_0002450343 /DNA_START=527 /DNA_END=796 /DNA_ORIENTATION=-